MYIKYWQTQSLEKSRTTKQIFRSDLISGFSKIFFDKLKASESLKGVLSCRLSFVEFLELRQEVLSRDPVMLVSSNMYYVSGKMIKLIVKDHGKDLRDVSSLIDDGTGISTKWWKTDSSKLYQKWGCLSSSDIVSLETGCHLRLHLFDVIVKIAMN